MVNSKKRNFGDKYYDASAPGSYSGLSGFVKNNKNMKNVKAWSMEHETECDYSASTRPLCDMQSLSTENDGYNFLLVNVNVFFKICNCYSVEK